MNAPIVINPKYLKALCLFTAKKDPTRQCLQSVMFGNGFMSATDGHTGLFVEDAQLDETVFEVAAVKSEYIERALKHLPKGLTEFEISFPSDDTVQLMSCPPLTVKNEAVGDDRPTWENFAGHFANFAAELKQIETSETLHQFAWSYADKFVKTAKILGSELWVLLPNSKPRKMARVSFNDEPTVYGLWMPVTHEVEDNRTGLTLPYNSAFDYRNRLIENKLREMAAAEENKDA